MSAPQLVEFLASGGPWAVLTVMTALWLSGFIEVRTKAGIARSDQREEALIVELRTSRDEWKALAQGAVETASELTEALSDRNRIDDVLLAVRK